MDTDKDAKEVTFSPAEDCEYVANQDDQPGWASDSSRENASGQQTCSRTKAYLTLFVVVFINLLNYMDRFTVSGVLTLIKDFFHINNKTAGLLQTVFICSYMAFAPIFGYLGDRYSRKYVMAIGVMIWSIMTYVGSLMGSDQFWPFFILRGLVGIGEASYSTVAPTIIADLFVGDARTKALSVFYFAIPCGSGLGFIVGSKVAGAIHDDWQWALRVTPGLGVLSVLMCVFFVHEPKRGAAETSESVQRVDELSASVVHPTSSYLDDLKYILKVRGFFTATIGFTAISFVIGSLAFWAPTFAYYSQRVKGLHVTEDDVSYIFGIITFIAGVLGVAGGAELARRIRHRNASADALVCGFGALAASPFLFLSIYLADHRVILTWILIAIAEILLCLNWVPNGDLLLYVIVPSRRATAEAVQILIIHLLGDAISPFIVGAVSDTLSHGDESDVAQQSSLMYALFMTPFVSVIGAVAYFICARYLPKDRQAAEELTKGVKPVNSEEALNSLPASDEDEDATIGPGVSNADDELLIPDVDIRERQAGGGQVLA